MTEPSLAQAYDYCMRMARSHYENFPVASRLLPRAVRPAVSVIYAFARSADDFADEGSQPAAERLAQLDNYLYKLDTLSTGATVADPIFVALADVVRRTGLPLQPLYDLLSAFRQDVVKQRYANFAEVLDYSRRSADPVGRMVLHLFGEATPDNIRDSDRACSALQLINFWQDLAQDYLENNRVYLPQDEMAAHGVDESQLATRLTTPALRALMDLQLERSRALLLAGAPLGARLRGRFGIEIRATIHGGQAILAALAANRDDVFARPRLRRREWVRVLWRALKGLARLLSCGTPSQHHYHHDTRSLLRTEDRRRRLQFFLQLFIPGARRPPRHDRSLRLLPRSRRRGRRVHCSRHRPHQARLVARRTRAHLCRGGPAPGGQGARMGGLSIHAAAAAVPRHHRRHGDGPRLQCLSHFPGTLALLLSRGGGGGPAVGGNLRL